MSGLLKADFRRILKDKLLLVMGILAVAFALITPLLYVAISSGMDEMSAELISGFVTGKAQFFSSFSIGNNLGLIAPVLLAIALWKDFSFGTIRNKIIAGKSRSQIFLSLFTTCAVVLVGVMMLHAFMTLGISLLFFQYQNEAFTVSDYWYFLESLAFELLVLLFVAAMISWLCASMKNVGLVIVFYIAISFLLTMVGSITQLLLPLLESMGGNETAVSILEFIDRINIGSSSLYIGVGTEYTREDVLYLTIAPIVGIAGFLGMGLLKFGKKDLK